MRFGWLVFAILVANIAFFCPFASAEPLGKTAPTLDDLMKSEPLDIEMRLQGPFVDSLRRQPPMPSSPFTGWNFSALRLALTQKQNGDEVKFFASLWVIYGKADEPSQRGLGSEFSNVPLELNPQTGAFTLQIPFRLRWSWLRYYDLPVHALRGMIHRDEERREWVASTEFLDIEGDVIESVRRGTKEDLRFGGDGEADPVDGSIYLYLKKSGAAGEAQLRALGLRIVDSPRLLVKIVKPGMLSLSTRSHREVTFWVRDQNDENYLVDCYVETTSTGTFLRECESDAFEQELEFGPITIDENWLKQLR